MVFTMTVVPATDFAPASTARAIVSVAPVFE
jgi:hypothetical protein